MAEVDITSVKELLGHKTLTMTLRYAHLAPSHKVKAVSFLEKTLAQKPAIQNSTTCRKRRGMAPYQLLISLEPTGGIEPPTY
jgi:hypothetical protein